MTAEAMREKVTRVLRVWEVCLLFFLITLGLELSDTEVYEPQIRSLFGTASRFWEVCALPQA